MKSLDEIIKALSIPAVNGYHYIDSNDAIDALRYLEEYQRYQNTPSRNGHMALVDYFEESQENEPLTWEQLKAMEGIPVWVEYCKTNMDEMDGHIWVIIHTVYERDEDGEEEIFCNDMCRLPKKWQGKRWQAYRKERE